MDAARAASLVLAWCLAAVLSLDGCRARRARPEPKVEPEAPAGPTASRPVVKLSLPPPVTSGIVPLEQTLAKRRSRRSFSSVPLSPSDLGQLAWAAQGISDPVEKLRTVPSAGALYPLELYFLTPEGVLHYLPETHGLERRASRDLRQALARAALDQEALALAPCDVVITSVTGRTRGKYGQRAIRYVAIEVGHAGQNLLLQATARGLAAVPIGAFDDAAVSQLLSLPAGEEPLYLVAIGYPPEAGRETMP